MMPDMGALTWVKLSNSSPVACRTTFLPAISIARLHDGTARLAARGPLINFGGAKCYGKLGMPFETIR